MIWIFLLQPANHVLLQSKKKGSECMDGDGHPDTCKFEYAKPATRLCSSI